jgi:two-component system, LytTR family, sensor kinase
MEAAELVGGLLRTTMEEERDVVSLRDEWSFVSGYVDLERIRFGDRLRVRADMDADLLDAGVPSFALQTLVENAVRHGAAPRIEPTDIVVKAEGTPAQLKLTVRNQGVVAPMSDVANNGTGLKRLRERLAALYGKNAKLEYGAREDGAFEAVVTVPRRDAAE